MTNEINDPKFDLNGKPPLSEAIPLGLQHLFAMIVGNIVPAFLLSGVLELSPAQSINLVQGSILAAAIGTLFQLYPPPFLSSYRIGSGLPVVVGASYVFLGACLGVAGQYGAGVLFTAQIIGAIAMVFFGVAIKKIRHIFTPVISGVIVTSMGIGLFPVAIRNLAGGQGSANYGDLKNFAVGTIVALIVLFLTKFGKGLLKNISILVGIIIGYAISIPLNLVDFSRIGDSSWFSLPKPAAFGFEFNLQVTIMFIFIFIISAADIMGTYTVTTIGGMNREVSDQELSSGVIGCGVTSIFSALLNSIPTAPFSQNAAIVSMNKVISKYVIATTMVILVIAGFSPKIAAIITTIPSPVIGGATLVVFSQIATAGIMLLTMNEFGDKEKFIAGFSLAVGLGLVMANESLINFPPAIASIIGDSSIVLAAIIAIILQQIVNAFDKKNDANKNINN